VQRVAGSFALLCLIVAPASDAHAGGPLQFSATGPIVWDTQNPIQFRIDRGDLGPIPAAVIEATIKTAFQSWTNVSTASIKFEFAGLLDDDVTTLADYMAATNNETGGNVVILDNNGDIVAEEFGEGNRQRILGFASPVVSGGRITAFYSLMNGHLAVAANTFLSTLTHEFGHAVGLDHTQIHSEFVGDGNASNDKYVPTMYPTSSDDDTLLVPPKPDDRAWVSKLYPSQTSSTSYGTIRGRLVRPNTSEPVLGANIIAIKQGTTEVSRINQFSCVSDWLAQSNGEFVIPVPPGDYKLHLEPIRAGFTAGSGVGPHAQTPSSPSFVNPINPSDPAALLTVTAGNETPAGNVVAE
jgi:hypothetical protein